MPLLTPSHSIETCGCPESLPYNVRDNGILQVACPCLPPATTLRHVDVLSSYRTMYVTMYFTGSMPLLTPSHNIETCGCPESLPYNVRDNGILQVACPCFPPATTLRHVDVLSPYRTMYVTMVFYR